MIWLTKLLKNVDGFYAKATGDINPAETPEEARARRRAKILADREEAQKAAEELQIQKERQASAESAGRAALAKLNSLDDFPEPLYEDFKDFMSRYTHIFNLIEEIKPNVISEKLSAAYEALEGINLTEKELQAKVTSFEEEAKSTEDKMQELSQFAGTHIVKATEKLLNNPYLRKSKSEEDAFKELNGIEDPNSTMWQSAGMSAVDFIKMIRDLGDDAQESAIYTIGDLDSTAALFQSAHKVDEDRGSNIEGEGVERAIQEGLAPGQNKQQAVNAAVRRYRANCREAARFKKNNNFHEHIDSAMKVAEQRERYEAALKADPIRYKKQKILQVKRGQRFRDRLKKLEAIAKAWSMATTPREKAEIKRKNKDLHKEKIYARGLEYESLREAEAMLDEDNALKQTLETVNTYSETSGVQKETINTKIQESKLHRGFVDLSGTIMSQKIASRPNDIKRSQSLKKEFERKLLEFETSQFAKYERDIELAHEKVMTAVSAMAKVEAEMQLNVAKTNLVKAQLAFKEQLDPVQKIREHLNKLKTIQNMAKALIKAGIIDNTNLLQPEQAPLIKQVVEQGRQLLSEYPFQDKVEALVAQELLDKLDELISNKSVPETVQEETPPAEIDLTEKLSSLNTGILMNKKSRKKILEKIEKQALQQTSFQSVINKMAPVDMNLPSQEYARQVYRSVSSAVAETIDDDLDRLIQELQSENQ